MSGTKTALARYERACAQQPSLHVACMVNTNGYIIYLKEKENYGNN